MPINITTFLVSTFVTVCLTLVLSKEEVPLDPINKALWFPYVDDEGRLTQARLTPYENETVELGSVDDVHFYLYTRNGGNPDEHDELFLDDLGSIDNSGFIEGVPLKVLVHGFGSSYTSKFPLIVKNAYLELERDLNIVLVDWERLAESPDYFIAFANTQVVSAHTAEFIDFLVQNGKVTRADIHIIGYSLGGQVVGQIGSRVTEKVARVTALDPALPLFDYADDFNRTDASDALFVDVMHVAANGFLTYKDPCGHVDWYPNGGGYQPGCGIDPWGYCAHDRAPDMYVESLFTEKGFHGRKCPSYTDFLEGKCANEATDIMGEYTSTETTGAFYLQTNSVSPYAKGPIA